MKIKKQEKLMKKFRGIEKAAGQIHSNIVFNRCSDSSLYKEIAEDIGMWNSPLKRWVYNNITEGHNLEEAEEHMKKIESIVERCYGEHEAKGEFLLAYYIAGEWDAERTSRLCRKACSHYEGLEKLSTARDFAEWSKDAEAIKRIDKKLLAMLEKESKWAEAGNIAERLGELEKAVECYGNAGNWKKAGEIAEKAGKIGKAAECYEKEALKWKGYHGYDSIYALEARYFEKAGDAAAKACLEEKSRQLYRKSIESYLDQIYSHAPHNILFIPLYTDAARVADKLGKKEEAEQYRESRRSEKRFEGF